MNPVRKPVFLLALLIVLSIGFFAFWIWLLGNLNNIRNENIKITESLLTAEKRVKNIKNLENLFNELKKGREEINESVIREQDDFVKFIEKLEFLAADSGAVLEIKNIRISQNQKESQPILKIELQGDFPSVYNFIAMMENLPYFILFYNAAIQKNPSAADKNENNKWRAEIEFSVLSYKGY